MVTVVGQDKSVAKRATCENCGAILEYMPAEVMERHGRDWSGGSDGEEWINCPRCQDKVVLRAW